MKALHLRESHAAAGARFLETHDREVVGDYGDVAAELDALRHGAALVDRSDRVTTRVDGRDRIRYLNSMITNDLTKLHPGQGIYALLLTAQGRFVSDLHLYVGEDHLVMVQESAVAEPGLTMLDRFLIADKVKFRDHSEAVGWLSVQGLEAAAAIHRALPEVTLPTTTHAWTPCRFQELEGLMVREDHLGPAGFDLMFPVEGLEALWQALTAAGATPVGRTAWEILRVENGIPATGQELTGNTIPIEAGPWLEARGISHTKGCYIGQEVICRVKARGHVNWMLTAFRVDPAVTPGTRLFAADKDVGWVTSVVESPARGRIGLGYVHRNARRISERLEAGAPGSAQAVELLELPQAAFPS